MNGTLETIDDRPALRFDDRAQSAHTAAGWDAYLDSLEAHLAGGSMPESDVFDGLAERHDA